MPVFSRLVSALLTLLVVSLVIFVIFQVIPGNAMLSRFGVDADPALIELMQQEFGLDEPPLQRYLGWLGGVLRGDFGRSLRFDATVNELIAARLPNTIALAITSFLLVLLIGLPLGLWLFLRQNTRWGRIVALLTQLLLATPVFALAILLMLVFGIWLDLLPISGYTPWYEDMGLFLRSLILPAFAISLPSVAIVVRYLQSSLQEQSSQDYVRTARNKGLSERQILYRHLLRNAFIPVLTILGVILINTLGGSIIAEAAFTIPGIGQLLNTAIRNRDLPLVQGISFYIAAIVVCGYLLLDLLYAWIDPRISDRGGEV